MRPYIYIAIAAVLGACGGGGSSTGTNQGNPVSETEEQSFAGKVIDGYIGNALVCLDLNNNLQCDSDEPSARTSSEPGDYGSYTFTTTATIPAGTQVLAEVGIDAVDEDRGPVAKPYNLLAPSDEPGTVTPLTTLVSQEILNSGKTLTSAEAEESVKTNLGFSEDTALLENDFVADEDTSLIATAAVVADALAAAKETLTDNDVSSEALTAAEITKSAIQTVSNNIGSIVAGGEALVTSEEVEAAVAQVVTGQVQAIVAQTLSGDGTVVDLVDVISGGDLIILNEGEYAALDDNGNGVWDKETEKETYYDGLYMEFIYYPEVGDDGSIDINSEDEIKAALLVGEDTDSPKWTQGWFSEEYDYVLKDDKLVQLADDADGTLEDNCVAFYEESFCFIRKDLSGKRMGDVIPGVCSDGDGEVVAGCDPDALLPDGAYAYDVQSSVPENSQYGGMYTIWGDQTWGGYVYEGSEQTIAQLIAQLSDANSASVGDNCNTGFRVGTYDPDTKTGTMEWGSNEDGGCGAGADAFAITENIETTAFEVLTFGETEILRVKTPLVYIANNPDDNRPYLAFAAVPSADGEIGVYGGDFTPSGTKIDLPFTGDTESSIFASRTLVDFVFEQEGIPAFPYDLFIDDGDAGSPAPAPAQDFQVSSSAFSAGAEIPLTHACTDLSGDDYSPQLSWQNAPENTDSFALIVDDETAPCGTGANACVHWNLFNIDGTVSSVVEDVSPSNVVAKEETSGVLEGQTYAGTNDYDGPCPPPGNAHTYYFTVYALSADHPTMTGSVSLTSSEFEAQYADTIIGQAQTTGTFSSGD